MSNLPNVHFPLSDSDQAEVIAIFNRLSREWNQAGSRNEAQVNRANELFPDTNETGIESEPDSLS